MHSVPEMMFGAQESFRYLECSNCGCLQLLDAPTELGRYYPSSYYSFRSKSDSEAWNSRVRSSLRRLRNHLYLLELGCLTSLLDRLAAYEQIRSFAAAKPSRDARILDVGCGSGTLLKDIADLGFTRLLGIDPFLGHDVSRQNGVEVRKGSLEDLKGTTWDLIMFHHSFEHIPNPLPTLRTCAELLSDEGCCLLRVPIASRSWRDYGVRWVEIDAPRHFFLHTQKSMAVLASDAGLEVNKIAYDSDGFELWGSELSKRGIPFSSVCESRLRDFFSADEVRQFRVTTREINKCGDAGRAAFYLSRAGRSAARKR
jgi:2-polyprenyl-3-methyl-5-hydroxy-6-metoxy-1,4-benzoquinol methylase